ncbi:MAG: hypothetical protein ABW292_03125 [Vicinamibacterales bacterium]
MPTRIRGSIAFIALGVASIAFAQQKPATSFDAHDLDGIWGRGGGGGGQAAGNAVKADARGFLPDGGLMTEWGPSTPLTPKGLEQVNGNKSGKGPRQVPPAFANDLLGDANPPGLLRALVYGRPFQMIVLPDKVIQLFEWTRVWREIWTDDRKPLEDIGPFWYGMSVGRWDKDTLVVETTGLDARAWMDQWGTPFSESIKVTERWRRTSKENLELSMTIDDPAIYARPWTTTPRNFTFQTKDMPDGEMIEVIFAPVDEQEFNERVRNPAGGVTGQQR